MLYIFQRLQPLATEVTRVATLLELLRPSIRRVIQSSQPADFDTLLTRASEAEFDEAEIIQPPKKIERQVEVPGRSNQPRELPKCWYFPGRHLNRDCPERDQGAPTKEKSPQENWRRGAPPGPAPPPIKLQTTQRRYRFISHFREVLNQKELLALFDSASTDNFIQSQYLTKEQLRRITPFSERVELAKTETYLDVQGTLDFEFSVYGYSMKTSFSVSNEIKDPLILGDTWIDTTIDPVNVYTLVKNNVSPLTVRMRPPPPMANDPEISAALSEVPPPPICR